MKEKFEDYMVEEQCPACHGKRLKEEVLSIRVGDLNIAEVTDMSVAKAIRWFEALTLSETQRMIGDQVLKEIKERLRFLQNVGLQYLTLTRRGDAVRRGVATDPAGNPDRFEPGGRGVCAG